MVTGDEKIRTNIEVKTLYRKENACVRLFVLKVGR